MKFLKFITVGMVLGITFVKAEIISWFRIIEMFRFESFHMYGVMMSALGVAMMGVFLIKRFDLKDLYGKPIMFQPKAFSVPRYLIGGIIFGLGWALTGACPGPMFALLGYGVYSIVIVIIGAIAGTFFYGLLRERLPH